MDDKPFGYGVRVRKDGSTYAGEFRWASCERVCMLIQPACRLRGDRSVREGWGKNTKRGGIYEVHVLRNINQIRFLVLICTCCRKTRCLPALSSPHLFFKNIFLRSGPHSLHFHFLLKISSFCAHPPFRDGSKTTDLTEVRMPFSPFS